MATAPAKQPMRQVFAANLRRARRWKDVSQEQLGFESGLSRAYVSSVERGVRNVSIDNMARLADALGIALSELVTPQRFEGWPDKP